MSGSLDGVRESLSYKAEATGYGLVATCGYSGLHSEASEWGWGWRAPDPGRASRRCIRLGHTGWSRASHTPVDLQHSGFLGAW